MDKLDSTSIARVAQEVADKLAQDGRGEDKLSHAEWRGLSIMLGMLRRHVEEQYELTFYDEHFLEG